MTRDGEAGLTLVEVMVALAIVAAMAGLTVMSLSAADRSLRAETEANRLAAKLNAAGDRALISGQPVTVEWDDQSYAVGGGGGDAAASHALPAGMTLRSEPRDGTVAILPGATGSAATWSVARGGAAWSVTFDGLSARVIAPSEAAR